MMINFFFYLSDNGIKTTIFSIGRNNYSPLHIFPIYQIGSFALIDVSYIFQFDSSCIRKNFN